VGGVAPQKLPPLQADELTRLPLPLQTPAHMGAFAALPPQLQDANMVASPSGLSRMHLEPINMALAGA
jgi:hypothetical protein